MTEQQKQLKEKALDAINKAEKAIYEYAKSCDIGEERIKAFQVYENIRLSTRI